MLKKIVVAACLAFTTVGAWADGTADMKSVIEAIRNGDTSSLPAATRKAIETGANSAVKSADLSKAPKQVIEFAKEQNEKWLQAAKEAYVAALPPKDRAVGKSLLLGDGTMQGGTGKLYFFVSRSMPESILRAYSVQAMYMGATLVVKGVRKGDTVKEYLEEVVKDFNNADGQLLAGMEINPDLYDMFDVQVVPTAVWTNRIGLEDIGSGCPNISDGTPAPKIELEGPNDTTITVDKPVCGQVAESSYYKIAGALATPYVLDRFQEAGAPKEAMDALRQSLAEAHQDFGSKTEKAALGNSMMPLEDGITIDKLPKGALLQYKEQLASMKVKRGPFGPAFSPEGDDDPVYRQELMDKVRQGLGE